MQWKNDRELESLIKVTNELTAIFVTILKNTKMRMLNK